ncbi:MAG: class I SAM-dependent methyltransferase [Winogradskyella sp.]|nr:class I SAM-dependent methyltransferase [Winogradskyella sp.]
MKDILGKALLDYHLGYYTEDIITWTNISDEDVLPLPHLFRSYNEMPTLEQKALQLANGKILDVGCGAGNHSVWLQQKGFDVKAIDISKGAIEVCKARGVKNVQLSNLLDEAGVFDTILLLMNGTGVFKKIEYLSLYLLHLKSLLSPGGQILIDSSDIAYMYMDDDGGQWVDINRTYYGELDYYLSYKGENEDPLNWLYLDFETLKSACNIQNLTCEKIMEGDHYDYLARIS